MTSKHSSLAKIVPQEEQYIPPQQQRALSTQAVIGLMSAINFCGIGFRRGLLLLAKKIFCKADVEFVLIAGGLIDAKQIQDDMRAIKRRIAILKAEIKERKGNIAKREKKIGELERRRTALKNERESPPDGTALSTLLGQIRKQINGHNRRIASIETHIARANDLIKLEAAKLEVYAPKIIARNLARALPLFVNAAGKKVDCIIVPSPVLDRELGGEVANLLQTMREDVRVYHANSGADRITLHSISKSAEILTPRLRTFRSRAMSPPVQKIISERQRESSREKPDVYFVGGCGVAFWTPKGFLPTPIVAIPSCHKPEGVPLGGGQIGVMVATIKKEQSAIDVELFPLKDMVSIERSYVVPPANATELQGKLITLIGREGKLTTSKLAELTNTTKQEVVAALTSYTNQGEKSGGSKKHFPGLWYEDASHRWDFSLRNIQMHLEYPPPNEIITLRRVQLCCPHFGSRNTDYLFFRNRVPEIILEKRATHLVCVGDFVEGLKHNLMLRGELIGMVNVTQQEAIASREIAYVMMKVFTTLFAQAIQKLNEENTEITPEILRSVVEKSLITLQFITGNHDEWTIDFGVTPLEFMKSHLTILLSSALTEILKTHGLHFDFSEVMTIVKAHIVHVKDESGYSQLPEGFPISLQHPHKGSSEAISQRAEDALAFADKALIVEEGNFHKGGIFATWSALLGTRIAVQLGTLKHTSQFERQVMQKKLDHGVNALEVDIDAATRRISRVRSESFSGDAQTLKTKEHRDLVHELLEYVEQYRITSD